VKKKRIIAGFILLGVAVTGAFVWLIIKAVGPKTIYPAEAAEIRTIELKAVAAGSVIPEKEVEVKSSLSGVVDEIYAEPGRTIKKGEPLLSIRVVPNSLDLNSAEAALEKASIILRNAETEMKRSKTLYEGNMLAEVEYQKSVTAWELAREDWREAKNRISLIREGISAGGKAINNIILSPITGTILDIPVRQGTPVQESGSYAAGTTVAVVADMESLIFEGEIDEAQIGSLETGMEANITLAAVDNRPLKGRVTFLSPRGRDSNGSIKFKVKISLEIPDDLQLRAGYSASAEIILKRAENILCVRERDLITEDGKIYVEVETGRQRFTRREITVGLSDGLFTEVTAGLAEGEKIKSLIK
jgi:HlyD family secretion protein